MYIYTHRHSSINIYVIKYMIEINTLLVIIDCCQGLRKE